MDKRPPLQKIGYRLFGFAAILWSVWAGTAGLLMLCNWLFSGHQLLKHNANLWIFWPVDWLYLVVGVVLVIKGAPLTRASRLYAWSSPIGWLHLAALLVYVVYWFFGAFDQDVSRVATYFAPMAAFFYWMISRREVPMEQS